MSFSATESRGQPLSWTAAVLPGLRLHEICELVRNLLHPLLLLHLRPPTLIAEARLGALMQVRRQRGP